MKAIITRLGLDGKYDEVGMNNRCIIESLHVNRERGLRMIKRRAAEFARGRGQYYLEVYYGDCVYGEPDVRKVVHLIGEGP